MSQMFYSMPFRALLATKSTYEKVDVETSVRQHIKMMLLTMPNQVRFDPAFGGALNKHHFRLPDKRKGEKKLEDELKDRVKKNLEMVVRKFEPRLQLKEVIVVVHIPKPDKDNPKNKSGKIALEITVRGKIKGLNTDFDHAELMPLL
jgi:predicted component of type VI protein secretion system